MEDKEPSRKDKWVQSMMEKTKMSEESALLMYHWIEDRYFWRGWRLKTEDDIDETIRLILESGARLRLLILRFRISQAWDFIFEDSWLEDFFFWCYRTWTKLVADPLFERKMRRQRGKRGYCDRDCWSMDTWMTTVLPAAIEQMADNLHGCPGCIEAIMQRKSPYEFKDYDDDQSEERWKELHKWWKEHLLGIARNLREANEETCSMKNEVPFHYKNHFEKVDKDPYYSVMVSDCTESEENDNRRHFEREKEIEEYRWKCFHDAMMDLSYLYGSLWD